MSRYLIVLLSSAILLATAVAVRAQDSESKRQPGVPLTKPVEGPASGSQNAGSTGWTGGAGSTQMGVTSEGRPESNQPEVVKGLDPGKDGAGQNGTRQPPSKESK
jgi:hypothetical protein